MNSGKTQAIGRSMVCVRWERGLRRAAVPVSRHALAIAFLSALFVMAVTPARAQTLSVLHAFTGTDGAAPRAGLIRDVNDNLYGTTQGGGAYGYGTVFMVTPSGTETVLYNFTGAADGAFSFAGLTQDARGNLFGTTANGGSSGWGTVFVVSPSGAEKVLYAFKGGSDGGGPLGGVILDAKGNLYGTTYLGGAWGYGTVFMVTPSGIEKVPFSFDGVRHGASPRASLIQDVRGNLYGTTHDGGPGGSGTVFVASPSGGEIVRYAFKGGSDGAGPYGGVIVDGHGNLYGTTWRGGAYGCGTVFMVTPSGTETVLYNFNSANGAYPNAGLVQDSSGDLYGTTYSGGVYGYGTVFKVAPSGKNSVLYSFAAGSDGSLPLGEVVQDAQGNLYGTTQQGGVNGKGVVFKLTP